MRLIKNKQGLGLPTALGISIFVIALISTLLTYAVFQARLIDKSIEHTEAYINTSQSISATMTIISNSQNFDSGFLDPLAAYMNVTISQHSPDVWLVTAMIPNSTKTLSSYFSSSTALESTYDLVFSKTGQEAGFELSPLVSPSSLLSAYLPTFISANFPNAPVPDFTDFNSIFTYIYTLTAITNGYESISPNTLVNQLDPTVIAHWIINGNVVVPNHKNLTIPDSYILFIDGDLTMNRNSTLSGNVVVNGNITINGTSTSTQHLNGSFYLSGSFTANRTVVLGTVDRPTFVLAERNILFNYSLSGYGYLFTSRNFIDLREDFSLFGGVYAQGELRLRIGSQIHNNPNLVSTMLTTFIIPQMIPIEGSGGVFVSTAPILN